MSIEPWISVPEGRTANLANWLQQPHNRWAFANVRQLLATEGIDRRVDGPSTLGQAQHDLATLACDVPGGLLTLSEVLEKSSADAFLVLKNNAVVMEHYVGEMRPDSRHVMFSVSKSVLGLLFGILRARGMVNPTRPVVEYLPELGRSAYADATVQHVLDMTVAVEFEENYELQDGDVARYRRATGWDPPRPGDTETTRGMLSRLPRKEGEHGFAFHYVSPGTDVAGWVVERVTGMSYAAALSEFLWKPMGAENSADMAVDAHGAARAAGGACATLRDIGRVGTLMTSRPVVDLAPAAFLHDTYLGGDPHTWKRSTSANYIPGGRYRNKWYVKPGPEKICLAIGIHGQWIYANHDRNIVIVKQSSQPTPSDDATDQMVMASFESISRALD